MQYVVIASVSFKEAEVSSGFSVSLKGTSRDILSSMSFQHLVFKGPFIQIKSGSKELIKTSHMRCEDDSEYWRHCFCWGHGWIFLNIIFHAVITSNEISFASVVLEWRLKCQIDTLTQRMHTVLIKWIRYKTNNKQKQNKKIMTSKHLDWDSLILIMHVLATSLWSSVFLQSVTFIHC